MSWDILLFNSKQKNKSVEAIDESQLEPTNFTQIIENFFSKIVRDDNHREIKGKDFSIGFFAHNKPSSNLFHRIVFTDKALSK